MADSVIVANAAERACEMCWTDRQNGLSAALKTPRAVLVVADVLQGVARPKVEAPLAVAGDEIAGAEYPGAASDLHRSVIAIQLEIGASDAWTRILVLPA